MPFDGTIKSTLDAVAAAREESDGPRCARAVLMVAPVHGAPNPEAVDNHFSNAGAGSAGGLRGEFDAVVAALVAAVSVCPLGVTFPRAGV